MEVDRNNHDEFKTEGDLRRKSNLSEELVQIEIIPKYKKAYDSLIYEEVSEF